MSIIRDSANIFFQALTCQLEDVVAEFEDTNEPDDYEEDDLKHDDISQRSEQLVSGGKDDCYSR